MCVQKQNAFSVLESTLFSLSLSLCSLSLSLSLFIAMSLNGGARGVMVIVVGNEHGDPSSNPGLD